MALLGKSGTFALEDSYDVLRKLEWEIDGFHREAADDADALCFRAFNIAVTAWALTEWVWRELSEAAKDRAALKKKSDFQNLVRTQCRALHICRQIATASKHVVIERYPDPDIATVVSAVAPEGAKFESNVFGIPASWTLKVVDRGERVLVADVFTRACDYWAGFIHGNRLGYDEATAIALQAPSAE